MVAVTHVDFGAVRKGDRLDVIDNEVIATVPIRGIWTEAIVVEKHADYIRVHYLCWDSSFDEVIPKSEFSRRVQPYGSKTYVEGGRLRRHNRIDVLDVHPCRNRWCTGFVVGSSHNKVLIHYKGYDKKFDEWISVKSNRLSPYGRKQFSGHPDLDEVQTTRDAPVQIPSWGPKRRHQDHNQGEAHRGYLQSDSDNPESDSPHNLGSEDQRADELRRQQVYAASLYKLFGLKRKSQATDGNCLFRSVSDQVYGNPQYHTIVREYTVDYMQVQRNSFQPFVAQSMRDFEVYLQLMRCNGTNYKAVWGGEPELQAMSELYQRPIIVYCGHPETGEAYVHAEYGKGFEKRKDVQPVRLNFYQYGHYDSAVPVRPTASNQEYPQPGQIELRLLKLLNSSTSAGSIANNAESQQLLAAIAESRQLWHEQSQKVMDEALQQSVQVEDQRALQMALQASTVKYAAQAAPAHRQARNAADDALPSHQKRSKPTTESKEDTADLDLVMAAVQTSLAEQEKEEDKALQQALKLSQQEFTQGGADQSASPAAATSTADAEAAIIASTLEASARDAKVCVVLSSSFAIHALPRQLQLHVCPGEPIGRPDARRRKRERT